MIAQLSTRYRDAWGHVPQGIALIQEVPRKPGNAAVASAKESTLPRIRENAEQILERIAGTEKFFEGFGYECPLRMQFQRTLDRGFPEINRFVDTLLLCEMSTGLLMGIQDAGTSVGSLVYDVAEEPEEYDGMRAPVVCKAGEIVIRDDLGIIASIFQGADKRTSITRATTSVYVFALGVPGMRATDLRLGLDQALEILSPCAAAAASQLLAS